MEITKKAEKPLQEQALLTAVITAYDNKLFLNTENIMQVYDIFNSLSKKSSVVFFGNSELEGVDPEFKSMITHLGHQGYLKFSTPFAIAPTEKAYNFVELKKKCLSGETKDSLSELERAVFAYAKNNSNL